MIFVVLLLFLSSGICAQSAAPAKVAAGAAQAARHKELEGETVPSPELAREPE
jgi:hypothetical protein